MSLFRLLWHFVDVGVDVDVREAIGMGMEMEMEMGMGLASYTSSVPRTMEWNAISYPLPQHVYLPVTALYRVSSLRSRAEQDLQSAAVVVVVVVVVSAS
jgi:hypothetical protein